jgi:hypothetical protein
MHRIDTTSQAARRDFCLAHSTGDDSKHLFYLHIYGVGDQHGSDTALHGENSPHGRLVVFFPVRRPLYVPVFCFEQRNAPAA